LATNKENKPTLTKEEIKLSIYIFLRFAGVTFEFGAAVLMLAASDSTDFLTSYGDRYSVRKL
jgi:hypothetical protein